MVSPLHPRPHRSIFAVAALFLVIGGTVEAFPPAPGLTVHGTVRDTYGWALEANKAEVVFRKGNQEIARTLIRSDARFSENYRVMLPVDTNRTGSPYKSGALDGTIRFTAEVQVNGAIYYPLETLAGPIDGGEAGGTLRLDLSLGIDEDGDGIPDDWEYWQLQAAGFGPSDLDYNLDQLTRTGDFDEDGLSDFNEYLAGTFAFLSFESLDLEITQIIETGEAECVYLAIIDKSYRVESSADMLKWRPEEVSLDFPYVERVTAWTSNQTVEQRIYLHKPDVSRFYRLIVR